MKPLFALSMLMFVLWGMTGCAGVDVERVADDDKAQGYRYYEQAPFLFVRSDGKGGLTSEVIFLPDTTRKTSIRPYAYLASNNATLSFTNGVLTEANVVGDETVIPVALLDALGKAASAAIAAANAPGGAAATVPVPYLFKIVVDKNGIQLLGGNALDTLGTSKATISVSLPTSGK